MKDEPRNLQMLVQNALDLHPVTRKFGIRVEDDAGVVVLFGKVYTYYAKQMAQEVVRPVLRAFEPRPVLRNLIEVFEDNNGVFG